MYKLPPYCFSFYENEQPNELALEKFREFVSTWNAGHDLKIELTELGDWLLLFDDGYLQKGVAEAEKLISKLEKEYGVNCFRGVNDFRMGKDFESCDFIQVATHGYADGFYRNLETCITQSWPCDRCGERAGWSQRLLEPPVVDLRYLESSGEPNSLFDPPGLDMIALPNLAMMINDRLKGILEDNGVKGYLLLPVIDAATGKETDRLYMLAATKVFVDYCHVHTPRSENAVCPACGKESGVIYGYPYFPSEAMEDYEVVSRNRFGITCLYFSKRVYELFKAENVRGFSPVHGFDLCSHPG